MTNQVPLHQRRQLSTKLINQPHKQNQTKVIIRISKSQRRMKEWKEEEEEEEKRKHCIRRRWRRKKTLYEIWKKIIITNNMYTQINFLFLFFFL